MKLPSKVKINTYTYTISEEDEPTSSKIPDQAVWGFCDWTKQEIVIRKGCTTERKRNTLLHEIMHAVFESVHANPSSMRADEIEEYFVVHGAPILVDVLRDNPAVVKYLVSKD